MKVSVVTLWVEAPYSIVGAMVTSSKTTRRHTLENLNRRFYVIHQYFVYEELLMGKMYGVLFKLRVK